MKTIIVLFLSLNFLLFSSECDKVVVISPPKCGSHLISKCVSLLINKKFNHGGFVSTEKKLLNRIDQYKDKNAFFFAHAPFNSEIQKGYEKLSHAGYKFVFILRDPRDQLVSLVYWQRKNEKYYPKLPLNQLNIEDSITELITGERFGFVVFERFLRHYLPWKEQDPNIVCTVQYEKLIGSQGGGSQEEQLHEILNLANHLNVNCTLDNAKSISENLFGGTWTFRSGNTNSWKSLFNEHQRDLFKERWGEELIKLEYEDGYNW